MVPFGDSFIPFGDNTKSKIIYKNNYLIYKRKILKDIPIVDRKTSQLGTFWGRFYTFWGEVSSMHKDNKFIVIEVIIILILTLFFILIVFSNKSDFAVKTHIVEVGEESTGYYCLIKYFDIEKLTPENSELNRQKCKETVAKIFGDDKAEHVFIRYKNN